MSALRARQAGLLVRPAVLGDGFAGLLVGAVGALGIALCTVLLAAPGETMARWPGWAAAALAAGTAGLLDDPARPATAASPTPLALRRGVGLAAGLPIVVVAWIAVLALVNTPYPPAALTVQAAALTAVALATAAVLLRTRLAERATLAARVVPVAVTLAAVVLPPSVALLAPAGRWAALLAVSALVLAGTSRRD